MLITQISIKLKMIVMRKVIGNITNTRSAFKGQSQQFRVDQSIRLQVISTALNHTV